MALAESTDTNAVAEQYARDGYLVMPDAFSPEEVEALRAETVGICRGERGEVEGVVPADPADSDLDVLSRYLCIHHPHKLSQLMRRQLDAPALVEVLTAVVGPNVKCMQSMLFIKSGGKPGQAWHQDEDFIPTRDRSLVGAWIALDDATVDNGCLWIIPGSHRDGILWAMREQVSPDFDCSDESYGFPYADEDAIPVEVPAGSVVFFNGYTLHRSLPNRTVGGLRRSLVHHYMSAESLLPWQPPGNGSWMALADHRDVVLVAGRDPYAYKGTEDIERPHVRPDREGGCKPTGVIG